MNRYNIRLPLLGSYQRINTAVAVATLESLIEQGVNITKNNIEDGLAATEWPGRFQIVRQHPLVIVDGAHNPAAACELIISIKAYLPTRPHPAILVIGASADKDIGGMVEVLIPEFDEVVITRARHPRSMDIERLSAAFESRRKAVHRVETVGKAIQLGMDLAGNNGLVCITGSLFVVGEALETV